MNLFKNVRFYTLVFTFLLSLFVYFLVSDSTPPGIFLAIKLNKDFGLLSILYLYITLLIGPFCYTFKSIPKSISGKIHDSRRAIGVGAFYFALLHTYYAFFEQLGGFTGLSYLTNEYLFSIGIGFISLGIMFILTVTSVDYAVDTMKFKNWKLLHRLVYFAGFLILLHTLLLGTDFSNLSGFIPQFSLSLLFFLLLLEAIRIDFNLIKFTKRKNYHLVTYTFVILSLIYVALQFLPQSVVPGINIHASH